MQNTIVMKWGLLMGGKIEWRGKNGRGKRNKGRNPPWIFLTKASLPLTQLFRRSITNFVSFAICKGWRRHEQNCNAKIFAKTSSNARDLIAGPTARYFNPVGPIEPRNYRGLDRKQDSFNTSVIIANVRQQISEFIQIKCYKKH